MAKVSQLARGLYTEPEPEPGWVLRQACPVSALNPYAHCLLVRWRDLLKVT